MQRQIDYLSFFFYPVLVGLNFIVLPDDMVGGRYAGLLMFMLLALYIPALVLFAIYNWLERKYKGILPLPFLTRPFIMLVLQVSAFWVVYITNYTLEQLYVVWQYVFTFLFFPTVIAFGTSGYFLWKELRSERY